MIYQIALTLVMLSSAIASPILLYRIFKELKRIRKLKDTVTYFDLDRKIRKQNEQV